MLADFADLNPGDWILQNGANSAVGLHIIFLQVLNTNAACAGGTSRDSDSSIAWTA